MLILDRRRRHQVLRFRRVAAFAAFRASIAMTTILIVLPEARRGWSWRTLVVGFVVCCDDAALRASE